MRGARAEVILNQFSIGMSVPKCRICNFYLTIVSSEPAAQYRRARKHFKTEAFRQTDSYGPLFWLQDKDQLGETSSGKAYTTLPTNAARPLSSYLARSKLSETLETCHRRFGFLYSITIASWPINNRKTRLPREALRDQTNARHAARPSIQAPALCRNGCARCGCPLQPQRLTN